MKEINITFASNVSAHKRHFWKDSWRFIIPTLTDDELEERGYFIDELVFKDGELREHVPYLIISDFRINKGHKKINKTISLMQKRIWRKEQKLYDIIRELFPNEFIKMHDRKTLKGLELDIFIRRLNLAFEYDGEQHFDKKLCEEVFKSDFEALQKRDRKKEVKCRDLGINLIRIKYDEPLNKRYIKNKIKKLGL